MHLFDSIIQKKLKTKIENFIINFSKKSCLRYPSLHCLLLIHPAYKEITSPNWPKSHAYYTKSYHIAWVITSKGVPIISASNWNHRHGKSQWGHAERVVWHKYQKLSKRRETCKKHETLYILVIRIMKDGTLGMSKPCSKCQASFSPKIKKVIYSTGDPDKPFDYMDL